MSEIQFKGRLLKKTREIPRICRAEFAENIDGYLDRISSENIAFIITDEGKPSLVVCPACWFSYCFDEEFGSTIICATKYALGCDSVMPGTICNYIRKNLPVIDMNTIKELIGIIVEGISSSPQQKVWEVMLKELQERKDYIETVIGGK
ncbi:MAG: hypothetical protein PHX51_02520 [Clostridia bacterium]|nr:hypothetical protein [Clostridia bacterium]